MPDVIPLKNACFYSSDKIEIDDVTIQNFVTTDNLLPNKCGITNAINLPPQEGNLIKFAPGNILISNIRPYLKKIWFADKVGGCSADVLVYKVKKGYDPKFVYYTMFRDDFFNHTMKGKKGTKMPRGDKNQMMEFLIPDFDLPKQQKITSVLSALDEKIEVNNHINADLEAMAKAIYDYWFVQFDFSDENGKPYKSAGGKMVHNKELKREIPDGWEVKPLDDIEPNIITGKTPSTLVAEYFNGTIPFICIGDVRGNMHITKTELTLTELGANSQMNKYIPAGAICVTCIASPGLVGFSTEKSQTNQQLNSIVFEKAENRYYLYFYLSEYFKNAKAKTGNTFANMNRGDFSSIYIIKPKDDTLVKFSKLIDPVINKVLNNSRENDKLAELRDWLLPMLMNGQVTIKDLAKQELDISPIIAAQPK